MAAAEGVVKTCGKQTDDGFQEKTGYDLKGSDGGFYHCFYWGLYPVGIKAVFVISAKKTRRSCRDLK